MAQHRHHQAAVGLRGDAQMHGAVARDEIGRVVVARIHLWKFAHRQHDGAHQQRQQCQLAARRGVLGVELLAQRFALGHVDFLDIGEVRNMLLCFLHLLRDLAAQADDRDGFLPLEARTLGRRCGQTLLAGDVGIDVLA